MVIGRFSEQGYVVESHTGEEFYSAGNSIYDSQVFVEPESEGACTVQEMERYCRQTSYEIAQEQKDRFGGIEYDGYLFIE